MSLANMPHRWTTVVEFVRAAGWLSRQAELSEINSVVLIPVSSWTSLPYPLDTALVLISNNFPSPFSPCTPLLSPLQSLCNSYTFSYSSAIYVACLGLTSSNWEGHLWGWNVSTICVNTFKYVYNLPGHHFVVQTKIRLEQLPLSPLFLCFHLSKFSFYINTLCCLLIDKSHSLFIPIFVKSILLYFSFPYGL